LLDAYLDFSASDQSTIPFWLDNFLINATDWLKENNTYLH
ncbi:7269_t:CDS:1, partial [Cetraspora pellucida]